MLTINQNPLDVININDSAKWTLNYKLNESRRLNTARLPRRRIIAGEILKSICDTIKTAIKTPYFLGPPSATWLRL